ncbi:glycosyltransferase family 9 protein [Legionella oakridgensis]|uniref:ADP-heptose:LPS heptosyltransferase n=2 Tax=Legionella oakridgensis TaxID=29423 RepID=W0BC25_9GAMM|nr:glycosyltransferase family 9 protein [Legionella oakridgensis]AHE66236.1 ADP-heptose:LPS heptosyltransferase [Legionella oakridgensis ATCC 33761 = DSM 21215]ETO93953.1 ADP-heptose:LPS heptosyltransferase [Legionella oakridgensis RV-2-2007]KTD44768.1 heptosyl transferase, glycosyltransferase family 9 protein [Legionella oakridgensis]STY16138.1 heptosyl transferase, glycosyltransferase family 9 protein [Legionella longbeachae]
MIRLPNWVGDVIMAFPALQVIKQNGIALQLLGKPWVNDLFAATDMPLITLEKKFWQTTKKIAKLADVDKLLLLTNSFSSALMGRLAGKTQIGYKTDGRQWLLTTGIAKSPIQHEVEYFWNLARFASECWFPQISWPKQIPDKIILPLSQTSKTTAKQALQRANITKPFWVLCPFAHGTGKDGKPKIWPHWRELAQQLGQRPLVVCPGKNEEHLCAALPSEVTVLSGLNLSEYAAILALAEQVLANDSGPMHLAAAVGANTLGIFGVSDPQRVRPWGADFIGSGEGWPSLAQVLTHLSI